MSTNTSERKQAIIDFFLLNPDAAAGECDASLEAMFPDVPRHAHRAMRLRLQKAGKLHPPTNGELDPRGNTAKVKVPVEPEVVLEMVSMVKDPEPVAKTKKTTAKAKKAKATSPELNKVQTAIVRRFKKSPFTTPESLDKIVAKRCKVTIAEVAEERVALYVGTTPSNTSPHLTRKKKCPRCGVEAQGSENIISVFGLRNDTIAQSYCRECRPEHAREMREKKKALGLRTTHTKAALAKDPTLKTKTAVDLRTFVGRKEAGVKPPGKKRETTTAPK